MPLWHMLPTYSFWTLPQASSTVSSLHLYWSPMGPCVSLFLSILLILYVLCVPSFPPFLLVSVWQVTSSFMNITPFSFLPWHKESFILISFQWQVPSHPYLSFSNLPHWHYCVSFHLGPAFPEVANPSVSLLGFLCGKPNDRFFRWWGRVWGPLVMLWWCINRAIGVPVLLTHYIMIGLSLYIQQIWSWTS